MSDMTALIHGALEDAVASLTAAATVKAQAVAAASTQILDVDDDLQEKPIESSDVADSCMTALNKLYASLQDASTTISHSSNGSNASRAFQDDSSIFDPLALWNELAVGEGKLLRSEDVRAWPIRVANIRAACTRLAGAQSALDGASARVDELSRDNSALSVELCASKSKLLEISSLQRVAAIDVASKAALADLKQENTVVFYFA